MLSLLLAVAVFEDIPAGWTSTAPPTNEQEWRCANYSAQEWRVSRKQGQLLITPFTSTTTKIFRSKAGVFYAVNQGEFGGKIEWLDQRTNQRLVIFRGNPVTFTEYKGSLYFAGGLAHLGMDEGAIYRLDRDPLNGWSAKKLLDIGEAPNNSVFFSDGTWTILTTTGITEVDLNGLTSKRLYENKNWYLLYSNSLLPKDGGWVIGARRAVIQLSPNEHGYTESWLVPSSCKHATGAACDCRP